MIEIKNNFLASKMNKDIDARLLPKNQYRHAENLQVNRSENSDAGTVQNILGNKEMKNFRAITGINDIDCIGVYANPSTDTLYIFLTNNTLAEYNPSAKNYIYEYNSTGNDVNLLVQGAFLNFSKNYKVLGINVLENFLFWTDNRNQPRKINITKAIGNSNYYTTEEQISVAKLSPLYSPNLYKASSIPAAAGKYETTMYNVSSPTIATGATNPYYDVNYIGDSAYLEDKYVRFSYRYQYEDGEYSIMAPFTQIAYIPKQDGYFMYDGPINPGDEPVKDDETAAYRSTIVSFMQNKVDQVKLQIALPNYIPPLPAAQTLVPCPANKLNSVFKIANIEILYKDANDINVSVVDSIPVTGGAAPFFNTTGTVYEYVYNSKKPFKTLPTKDSTRVNDIVPIKALCQEIISNRVVYSNYQNKASYPKYLDYNVGYGDKSTFEAGTTRTSRIEYPNHSLKENRNYQVGVILADRFGRESGVILSSATSLVSGFGASSLYVKYRGVNSTVPAFYPGLSLKVLFNSAITTGPEGWPGLYNGDSTSPNYNPLGWYSYKIVVKQTEQDYYNVYLPGFMAAYPGVGGDTKELGKTSHVVLINDNINKVPRDLTEVGPAQLQFRSSVALYPRVENNTLAYDNQQSYPGNTYSFVNTIATNNSLFFPDNSLPSPVPIGYSQFYQLDSDPLIARIATPSKLGVVSTSNVINLSISETKPFDSKLDIYWETSTAGLISDINSQIGPGTNGATKAEWSEFELLESASGVRTVISSLTFKDALDNNVVLNLSQINLLSVVDGIGTNLTSKFEIQTTSTPGQFKIVTTGNGYFIYQSPAGKNQYTFTITSNSGTPNISSTYTIGNCLLDNATPVITAPSSGSLYTFDENTGVRNIVQFTGQNGSADAANNQIGLNWYIDSASSAFSINQSTGLLTVNTNILDPNDYTVVVRLEDASGISGSKSTTRSVTVRIADVITCSDYLLSGGSFGRSFAFKSCDGTQRYLSVGAGESTVQCVQLPFSADGATLSNVNCTNPTGDCAVYEFKGGPSGRTFTNVKYCGLPQLRSIIVPANTSITKCIQTPYVPTIEGAVYWGECPPSGICKNFELSGGTTGHTFTYIDCNTGAQTSLSVNAYEIAQRCIELPYHDDLAEELGDCAIPTVCDYTYTGEIAAVTPGPERELTGTISVVSNDITVFAEAVGLCGIYGCDEASTTVYIYQGATEVLQLYSRVSINGVESRSAVRPLPPGEYSYLITLFCDGLEGMSGQLGIICPE